jgi:hypothetical protein
MSSMYSPAYPSSGHPGWPGLMPRARACTDQASLSICAPPSL